MAASCASKEVHRASAEACVNNAVELRRHGGTLLSHNNVTTLAFRNKKHPLTTNTMA